MAEPTGRGRGLDFAGESNIGLHRRRNEDSFCVLNLPGSRNQLAVIADGVGGHTDGELASFLCCRRLLLNWRNWHMYAIPDGEELEERMRASIMQANRDIYMQNKAVHHTPPMCTTVVAAVFTPERVVIFHVGDSRFSVVRDGVFAQITVDHCFDSETCRNVISRALGPRSQVAVDMDVLARQGRDRYVLYSDGLSTNIDDDRITATVAGAASARRCVDQLLREALLAGGNDNISVVAVFPQE